MESRGTGLPSAEVDLRQLFSLVQSPSAFAQVFFLKVSNSPSLVVGDLENHCEVNTGDTHSSTGNDISTGHWE